MWVIQRTGASVLKALGVKAVVAKSFARIFYRNSINIGLPVIISKDLYDKVEDGTDIDINLSEGWIKTEDETLPVPSCHHICRIS